MYTDHVILCEKREGWGWYFHSPIP